MKRRLFWLLLIAGLCCGPAFAQDDYELAVKRMADIQAKLEFFFMEAGLYPAKLSDMETEFNPQGLPDGLEKVNVPNDPATGKPFAYKVGPKHKSYTLSMPDPAAYGGKRFELQQAQWGWLALRAEQRRFEKLAAYSKKQMELLATQVEMYAKDSGKYPEKIDDLFPKYIRRHPQDPLTGKNYTYERYGDGYIIKSPNPERYGLKIFQYNSSKGWQVEALPPEGGGSPKLPTKEEGPERDAPGIK